MKRCECGDLLTGHEDESSTKCRWCVTGWKQQTTHVEAADCWCHPTLDTVSDDGASVYVHHKPT